MVQCAKQLKWRSIWLEGKRRNTELNRTDSTKDVTQIKRDLYQPRTDLRSHHEKC